MSRPLVTEVRDDPTLAILFNDAGGMRQVADLIGRQHAFVKFEGVDTADEEGRPAYLLLVWCETATADQLYELIGSRLPDYITARKFPPSMIEGVRASAAPAQSS